MTTKEAAVGDHRAEVKLEMTLHGKTYKHTFDWINWDIYGGCDQRVIETFEEWSRDALSRFNDEMAEAEEAATERKERAELARLKAKYPADQSKD